MRYIITKDQFHKIAYNILDEMLEEGEVKKELIPNNSYRIEMFNKNGDEFLTYIFFEEGEDDDGNFHNGHGSIFIHWSVDDKIRKLSSLRKSKVLDIIADWVTEKFDVNVDEVYINPKKPSNY